jgi:uncharacterized protein (DUF885 family)
MNNPHLTRRALNAGLATSLVLGFTASRATAAAPAATATHAESRRVAALADAYYEESLALFPMGATENLGDARYEGAFEIEIAPAHLARQKAFYERTLAQLARIPRDKLDADARLTWDLLKYECDDKLATLPIPFHLVPVGHVDSMPVKLSQWAGGESAQPMKTVANYDHFLQRLKMLPAWIDQAIANMREGMARGITQPRELVERTLPQFDTVLTADPLQSPYLAATRNFPAGVGEADRKRITAAYRAVVQQQVVPAVRKLRAFLADTYLPAARTTAGLAGLPGGREWYPLLVRSSTTTSMTPTEVHELGLKEVARIRAEMETVKAKLGFDGDLDAFFQSLDKRPELKPFKTEDEVIAAYRAINDKVKLGLPRLFDRAPKAALQIKAIEPVRRATASDNYVPPASDGSRPGVFYAVVNDPADYSRTTMTSLFLHEGQPGHHYQIGLQRELSGPRYRQATWYDAYGEGWALYAESLGRDLGVYDDPVAYLGRLFMELHRALRLVVDTGLHDKGWSRVQTIAYLRSKEGSTEDSARRATERYMAWPGQALSYKVGELKIIQLRERARQALGARFDIRAFHRQVLGEGCMPLSMLEAKIDRWIAATAKS